MNWGLFCIILWWVYISDVSSIYGLRSATHLKTAFTIHFVLSHVWLFVAPWTAACQTLLSVGFSSQEYWHEVPFPPPGHLPDPGIESMSLLHLLHWQAGSLPLVPPRKPYYRLTSHPKFLLLSSGGLKRRKGTSGWKLLLKPEVDEMRVAESWQSSSGCRELPVKIEKGWPLWTLRIFPLSSSKIYPEGFPGGLAVKNQPATGDTGLTPSPGRVHVLWDN